MKKLLPFMILMFLLNSCSKEEEEVINNDSPAIGKWQLKETLFDPGDGSGTYQEVSSDKTVEFFKNGKVSSNGSLCQVNPATGNPTTGTFSTSDSRIRSDECNEEYNVTRFKVDGDNLFIYQSCIEGCAEKYIRI